MTAFEKTKKCDADIESIQKSYVSGDVLSHLPFAIKSKTMGEQKKPHVAIRITITTRNRLIVGVRIDIIHHSYIQALNI